jgi:hypothetical protein
MRITIHWDIVEMGEYNGIQEYNRVWVHNIMNSSRMMKLIVNNRSNLVR